MSVILKAENISKQYRLGTVGSGTISDDLKRWWYTLQGKEDPFLKVGAVNDRNSFAKEDYVWALKDINFEVKQGEVLGIIGKNGAGKSTLLKLLSRVTSPTTGTIKTRGRIASLLEVGTGFHGELTGRENIFMNGAVLGMTKAEIRNKLDEIIAFSGCEKYIDTPVKRYSSGMTVRLGFAVAAHLEPEILVVDEVLAVGDAEFQKKAIGKMQDLSTGEGRTVLFVSHNMASVQNLCNNIIVLENGIVGFSGDVDEGIDFHLNSNFENKNNQLNEKWRKGAGQFKITSLQKLNSNYNQNEVFRSGEDLILKIEIDNSLKIKVENFRLDFGLDDKQRNRITWFSTTLNNNSFSFDKKDNISLNLKIPKIPLRSGLYYLTSNLIINDTPEDWVPNICTLNIENGDFFGTGKVIENKQGSFLIPHKFEQC